MSNHTPHLAILASFSGEGGVERMILNLAKGLLCLGCRVELLCIREDSPHLKQLPSDIKIIPLGVRHALQAVMPLAGYLRKNRPDGLIAAKDRAGQAAVLARLLSGVQTRLAIRIGTTVSAAIKDRPFYQKWAWYLPMRILYARADRIIGVSEGVAQDIRRITGLDSTHVIALPNPVIHKGIYELATHSTGHIWLDKPTCPVILGIGRLTRQKDFHTLIKAFSLVYQKMDCRLVILGRGRDEASLRSLAQQLKVATAVDFAGWSPNPYAFLSKASLFVLSSRWEGSPNVLTEAMALGVPCVATDCPSGPSELLTGELSRHLVPVEDHEAMARAMLDTLQTPPNAQLLKDAVRPYEIQNSARHYLNALFS
jgi:glycosyltransferase involved in cell wall biosynthesis